MDVVGGQHAFSRLMAFKGGDPVRRRKPNMESQNNEELDKLIKHKNIINYIKAERLSWFGHVQRLPDTENS